MANNDIFTPEYIFESLYWDINGYDISRLGRKKMEYQDRAHTYGEVVPETFHDLLIEANPQKGEVFYDLGSGTGRAVMLAALLFNFSESYGIEIVEDLYNASQEVLTLYNNEYLPKLSKEKKDQKINFFHGDFLKYDLSEGDVILMASTCFYPELMQRIDEKLLSLKPGSRIVSMSQHLLSHDFEIYKQKKINNSWGATTIYYHKKI